MKIKYTEEQLEFIKQNYQNNGSLYCSQKTGLSQPYVRKIAMKLELKIPRILRNKLMSDSKKMYFQKHESSSAVKHNLFIKDFTKESVYILGFIWADGYIKRRKRYSKISIEIVKDDFEKIDVLFNKTGKWTKTKRSQKNRRPQSGVTTSNYTLYNFLKENDYEEKSLKSANKILSKIPEELKHYWWRGYFDGDGCFYKHKNCRGGQCTISGAHKSDWNSCENLLKELNITFSIRKVIQKNKNGEEKSRSSYIYLGGMDNITKFGNFIYGKEYDKIGLERKYLKYLEIIK